jgi:hypothetical protein
MMNNSNTSNSNSTSVTVYKRGIYTYYKGQYPFWWQTVIGRSQNPIVPATTNAEPPPLYISYYRILLLYKLKY